MLVSSYFCVSRHQWGIQSSSQGYGHSIRWVFVEVTWQPGRLSTHIGVHWYEPQSLDNRGCFEPFGQRIKKLPPNRLRRQARSAFCTRLLCLLISPEENAGLSDNGEPGVLASPDQ